jgi:psiF repeat-containing protein
MRLPLRPDDGPLINQTEESKLKKLIAVVCFMLATSPLALAQEKGKAEATKAAPPAEKSDKAKAEATKAAPAPEKSAKAKKEPSEKQKAQQDKMKSCSKEASDKKMKGDERKSFMSTCMKADGGKGEAGKAPAKK